tara:strand:- start:417 stop:1169 length:753 start_codon:yes stop_codon:yes gene_type:complete
MAFIKPRQYLSEEEVFNFFDKIMNDNRYAFNYRSNGCYIRAHLMCKELLKLGITPKKLWIKGKDSHKNKLYISLKDASNDNIRWKYHVVPVVAVQRRDGSVQDMAIDPMFYDGPVDLEEYKSKFKRHRRFRKFEFRLVKHDEVPDNQTGNYCVASKISTHKDITGVAKLMKFAKQIRQAEEEENFKSVRKLFPTQMRKEFVARSVFEKPKRPLGFRGRRWQSKPDVVSMTKVRSRVLRERKQARTKKNRP